MTSSHEFISCQCWVQIGSYNYDTPPHNRRQLWQCDNRLDLLWVHKGPTRFLHLPCPVAIICAASFSPIINAHFALKSYAQPEARGNVQKLMHIGEHQTFQVGQYATFWHFHKHLPAKQIHIHETCHCHNLQKLWRTFIQQKTSQSSELPKEYAIKLTK